MLRFFLALFISVELLAYRTLSAEIQSVGVTWEAAICLSTCIPLLEKNLRDIEGSRNIRMNPQAGRAELGWDPRIPFRFEPFNLAFRLTGVSNTDIRLRVRGKIAHDDRHFYLISTNDGTRFQLAGTAVIFPNEYNISDNIELHPLTQELTERLLLAESKDETAVVEGPLFQPERYTLILIVEQIRYQKAEEKGVERID